VWAEIIGTTVAVDDRRTVAGGDEGVYRRG
jgi:hypothetical protein